jgi:DNA modification methylase
MIKSEDIQLGSVCVKVFNEDCLNVLREMPSNSVDAIVSDPPYGISFMAKKWDYDVPSVEVWKEAMRVLKPGGHALIACGTRTQHRMVVNIDDAGFEIRDVVSWIYGSGFPKSLNISKAIDKAAGAEREVVGSKVTGRAGTRADKRNADDGFESGNMVIPVTAPATEAAEQWDGWGTALKPACEFFTLCRKPLSESTVAKNVLKWGTGGINIDGCRVGTGEDRTSGGVRKREHDVGHSWQHGSNDQFERPTGGRFPANLIHDGSQEVLDLFPETHAPGTSGGGTTFGSKSKQEAVSSRTQSYTDSGSAARFFYCPKASKKDRNEGCEKLEGGNNHATVKPTALMAYLCRLITPMGGTVLDPYMGSGSTGKAAVREGFSFVGIELDQDYYEIAKARVCS